MLDMLVKSFIHPTVEFLIISSVRRFLGLLSECLDGATSLPRLATLATVRTVG